MIKSTIKVKLALCALGLLTALAPAAAQKSYLWKVESRTATVYLLGSIHVAKAETYPLDKEIEEAYAASDTLGVEVDIASDQVNSSIIMQHARYGGDTTLKMMVKPETYKAIVEELKKHSIPELFIAKTKPWFAIMMLLNLELAKGGFDKTEGVDMHFLQKAKRSKKPIIELESIEFQLKLFERFDQYADDYFAYSIKEAGETPKEIDSMLAAWKKGDDKKLEGMLNEATDEFPALTPLMDALLTERNITMTTSLERLLERNGKYFIVVGAGHLIGEKGIVNDLKSKGKYKIKRY
ncbi:MAG: TraB/GumN family protein [Chloroflexota bacterium]